MKTTHSATGKRIDKAVRTLDACFAGWYNNRPVDTLLCNDITLATMQLVASVYGLTMVKTGNVVTFAKNNPTIATCLA